MNGTLTIYKDGDAVKLKRNHKYFTQRLIQMGVTKTKTTYSWFGIHIEW